MHAAFAADAMQMVEQIVTRTPSVLAMNVPVPPADWTTALHTCSTALRAGNPPRASAGLRMKNSTSRLASFARKGRSEDRFLRWRGPVVGGRDVRCRDGRRAQA